jgi:pilus assembly protein FimV
LQAEIAVSATAEELEGLRIALAPREAFARYGLDRPEYLSELQFRVVRDGVGRNVIRMSSRGSIAEPFVTVLLEASWPRGRLLREYTMLLDPPVLLPEPVRAAQVRPAETRQPAAAPGGQIARVAPPQSPPRAAESPSQPSAAPRLPAASSDGTYGPVQRAETLWGIAERFRPDGVSMNQMMIGVYRANPEAFDGNMNFLHRGAVLRLPDLSELQAVTSTAANAEVARQNEAWQGGQQQARLRLVPASDASAGAASPAAPGASADSAAATAATARLESEVESLRSELEESRRLLELRNAELRDLQEQLSAEQSASVAESPSVEPPAAAPGVDLESEQLFADEPDPVEAAPEQVEPADVAEPAVEQPSTQPPAVRPGTQVVTSTPAEPSLVSRVVDWLMNPMLLIAVGVAALLIAGFAFVRGRRSDPEDVTGRWEALESEVDDDEIREATERMRRQVSDDGFLVEEQPPRQARGEPDFDLTEDLDAPAAETQRPAAGGPAAAPSEETLSSQTVINLDQADPVAEADFHMAYGLYDQAAELISKALEAEPSRRELKLKLLEVFFVWGNKEAFLGAAQGLRREMGDVPDGDWDKVVIMGKQIVPDEPLFADATAGAQYVDVDLDAGDSPALDLAFDDAAASGVDLDFGHADDAEEEDYTLEATGDQPSRTTERDLASDFGDSGLDIGERTAAGLEAALFEPGDADAAAQTSPELDVDSLAVTQESPTVETPGSSDVDDWDDDHTVESRTQEMPSADSPTVETPTVETAGPDAPTMETPTVETTYRSTEPPTVEQRNLGSSNDDGTAEIDLDDLGLDVDDLEALPDDLGELPSADDGETDTREQPKLAKDDDLLSATGVTQVLRDDDELEQRETAVLTDEDATMLAPGFDDDTATGTAVLDQRFELDETGDTSLVQSLREDDGLDLNLDDLSAALQGADTVEQPRSGSHADVFSGNGNTPVDLDIGVDAAGADDPTGTEEVSPLDPQTMTEVGTKLDLARAYIDMGDPEGARSILEEVLDEGDPGQRREAQGLIDVLSP